MRVVIPWRNPPAWVLSFANPDAREQASTLEDRREAFHRRLERVPYYQERGPDSTTPLRHLYEQGASLEDLKGRSLRAGFRSPIDSDAVTVVGVPLEPRKGVTVLPAHQWQKLHLSRVRLLAATPPVLRQVVACVECSLMAMPRLSDAIVVLNTVEHGLLHRGEREMLWRCFGLPVYEQWLGLEGELLAWECEAHLGLHLNLAAMDLESNEGQLLVSSLLARRRPTWRLETGWTGEIDYRPCLCGETSPRLRGLRPWQEQAEPALKRASAVA